MGTTMETSCDGTTHTNWECYQSHAELLPNQAIYTFDSGLLILQGVTLSSIIGHTDPIPYPDSSRRYHPMHAGLIGTVERILQQQSLPLTIARLKSLCSALTVGRGYDYWGSLTDHWTTFQDLWLEARKNFAAKTWRRIGKGVSDDPDDHTGFTQFLGSATYGRRVFVTADGIAGLGPSALQAGDVVVVLLGGFTPFVLRPVTAIIYSSGNATFMDRWMALHSRSGKTLK